MMKRERIRVLMVGPDRSVHGGVSGMVNNYYAAGLDRMIDLCYVGTMVDGSKVRKLAQAVKAYILFLLKLPEYDIVHVNVASDSSYYRKSVFIRTAGACHRKVIIHQHGGSFQEFYEKKLNGRGRRRVQKVLSMGDAFLVLGTEWKNFFSTVIKEEKITVFPNAVQIPAKVNKIYGSHKILFLGRLCKDKGIGELLDVFGKLRTKYPDIHLYLAGVWEDDGLRIKARKLGDSVTETGWISGDQKLRYLRECDIFVLPSYFEGQPVSILEAMSYACGIVASGVGDIPDMIVDGETGFLAAPRDEESLEAGLDKLLADPELCRILGENARRKAETEFSIEKSIRRLLDIYKAACGGKP